MEAMMVDKLPEEFGAALDRAMSANLFMFAQLFKTLIDKNIIGDDDLRKFLNAVEKAGCDEKKEAPIIRLLRKRRRANRPTEYLPELPVMVERLRRDLLGEEPEPRF